MCSLLLLLLLLLASAAGALSGEELPVEVALGVTASELAVVVNVADPQSRAVGAAYAAQRGVPPAQVVLLNFTVDQNLPRAAFAPLKAQLDAALPANVQALVLTWLWPFRVDCMSVTSAFAFGFNTSFCGQCTPTAPSPLYNSTSTAPFTDFGVRPAFLLAGWSAQSALRTLAAGIAADGTHPRGDGFAFRTFDVARSVRFQEFQAATANMAGRVNQTYEDCRAPNCSDWGYLVGQQRVLTYWQSIIRVANLSTNTFLPGAVGDHLTSYGGILTNTSGQMPCLEYTEAGATASFGTVVEPCNFCQKFPDPSVFWPFYADGAALVEAYWKSVAWPGEGLFVGEPLARPYGAATAGVAAAGAGGAGLRLQLDRALPPGGYAVRACAGARGAGVLGCGSARLATLEVAQGAGAEFWLPGVRLPPLAGAGAGAGAARVLLQRVRVAAAPARAREGSGGDPDGCPPVTAAAVPLGPA
jgi:uncharacterized protein (TIGR03790 family)